MTLQEGSVITFYSYKGGTGRTMALANIACLLAQDGKKVLIIDWDLEAPGLHRYFEDHLIDELGGVQDIDTALKTKPGLIDIFLKLWNQIKDNEVIEGVSDDFFKNLHLDKYIIKTDIENLYLLKAGHIDDDYAHHINMFRWDVLYNKAHWLFHSFAQWLKQEYQYVLIDSRTGLTDVSGICTMLMPDTLVAVFIPNHQNLDGLMKVVRDVTNHRRISDDSRPLVVFPLASRIEMSEEDLRDDWRFGDEERGITGYEKRFTDLFKEVYALSQCELKIYFDKTQIPHRSYYAYGEEIAVLTERDQGRLSLTQGYKNIANWLTNSEGPWDTTGAVLEKIDGIAAEEIGGDVIIGNDVRQIVNLNYFAPLPSTQIALERYLRRLRRLLTILPLGAMGGDEDGEIETTLDQIYIAPDTRTRVLLTQDELVPQTEKSSQTDRPLTAIEAAFLHRRLVLLGEPGSGKSTFVRQLTAWLAAARLGEQLPPHGWSAELLPLFMVLRDLMPRLTNLERERLSSQQREQRFIAALRQQWLDDLNQLGGGDLTDVLVDALTEGQVLLIFDGLDEVPETMRGDIRLALSALLKVYPRVQHVIVTCRVRSYIGNTVLPSFTSHTLAEFDQERIKTFIQAWYHAQVALGRLDAIKAKAVAEDLWQAVLSSAFLELARNPMLLTTMAIIHQREVRLPRERVRFYSLAVELLLSRWQMSKEVNTSPTLSALLRDNRKLRMTLEQLAYEAHRQHNKPDLSRGELLALLEAPGYLADIGLASEFLDYVDQRAGLLVGRGGDAENGRPQRYAFPHRIFQEYLAGCYLITGRGVQRTYWQHANEGNYWQLAAHLGAEELLYNRRNEEALLDLMYGLCPVTTPQDATAWRSVLWSGHMAALLGAHSIRRDNDYREGGANYLSRLIAHLFSLMRHSSLDVLERAEGGQLLAQLGDPRQDILEPTQMEFCYIPTGRFVIDNQYGLLTSNKSQPQQTYSIDYDYWIARYPVTNAQFQVFVDSNGYTEARYWPEAMMAGYWIDGHFKDFDNDESRHRPGDYPKPFGLPNHPIIGITWYEAIAFTHWLNEQLHQHLSPTWAVRLPTESEWEKAARGGELIPLQPVIVEGNSIHHAPTSIVTLVSNPMPARLYPWGEALEPNYMNYAGTKLNATNPVGCFPQGTSPYGVEEMCGNVWEWMHSLWSSDYPNKYPSNHEELNADLPSKRVLRGGAFNDDKEVINISARIGGDPRLRQYSIGFRIAVSPISSES